MNSRYEVVIFWSDKDDRFVAEVPELPGCMADGATYQEAARNADEAIQDWVATAAQLGRVVPAPKRRQQYA